MQFLQSILPPHFTRRNRIIFFLALLFSLGSFIALLKVTPKDESQSHVMLATIVEQNQYVTRKFSNSLSFIEVNKGEKLFNGDQIFTGENSSAKVVFKKSGNILNIPPRGLVKIEESATGENVDIQKGLAEFVIQKGQTMNITQGAETITLKSTGDEIGKGKIIFSEKKMIVQVDSGKISLDDTKGKVQELNKNETVAVDDKEIKKVVGVGLTNPVWGQQIDIWNGMTVEWSQKGAIEIALYKDSALKILAAKTTATQSPYSWNLPVEAGQYYMMVKPVGHKSKDGSTIPLEMISAHSINSFNPADRSAVNLKRGQGIKLSWNEVPANKYKVVVRDHAGRASAYSTEVPELTLPEVKGASLEWSVAPQLKSGIYLPESKVNHIELAYDGENKILSPKENQNYLLGKDKIQLSWSKTPTEKIHLKLINTNTNSVAKEVDTADSKMELIPEVPGSYSMEVSSKDYPSAKPAVTNFNVTAKVAEWEAKSTIELTSYEAEEKKVELKFTPAHKDLNDIEVSIYSEAGLKNKLASAKVQSSTIIYTVKRFGDFCFVLRPVNKTSVWLPSSTQCISYKELAPFDKVAATKNIVLKYAKVAGVGSYLITLPVMERAESYEIQVYDDAKNVVFSDKSKNNVITWPSSKTGIFYYKFRVVDKKGRTSDYSGVSKLIFPISPLTEWQE